MDDALDAAFPEETCVTVHQNTYGEEIECIIPVVSMNGMHFIEIATCKRTQSGRVTQDTRGQLLVVSASQARLTAELSSKRVVRSALST